MIFFTMPSLPRKSYQCKTQVIIPQMKSLNYFNVSLYFVLEEVFKKLSGLDRDGRNYISRYSWQKTKHAKL